MKPGVKTFPQRPQHGNMSKPHTHQIQYIQSFPRRVSSFKRLEIRPRMIKSCDILGTLLGVEDLIVQRFHLDAVGAFADQFCHG